jgi:hypothetical protein
MGSPDKARDMNNILSKLPSGTFIHIHSKHLTLWEIILFQVLTRPTDFGYETVMGATYAAMFPNSFDRMTQDGSFDAVKVYDSGNNDPVSIQDGEKGLQAFFDSCAAATPCTITDPDAGLDPSSANFCTGCYFHAPTAAGVKVWIRQQLRSKTFADERFQGTFRSY